MQTKNLESRNKLMLMRLALHKLRRFSSCDLYSQQVFLELDQQVQQLMSKYLQHSSNNLGSCIRLHLVSLKDN